MLSSPTTAAGVAAGVLVTTVAAIALKVRQWERQLDQRWQAFDAARGRDSRLVATPEFHLDLPADQPLDICYIKKSAPSFCVHQT
jgi:hypothetical protein